MSTDRSKIKCPKCGGPVNNEWVLPVRKATQKTILMLYECWCGDLGTDGPHHYFTKRIKLAMKE